MSSQLQHNLQQFEAMPPKEIWLAIEKRLNETESFSLQERLLAFETMPPSETWQHIETSLTSTTGNKKTIYKKVWFRYAAAAAVLGVVAISIFTFAINQPKNSIAQQPATQNQLNTTELTQQNYTSNEAVSTSVNKENSINRSITDKERNQQNNLTNTLTSTTSKRYKVIAKEDGKLVRFSQKALAVFDCAVKATAIKSERCKENIQSMQAKMATSMNSPTADFAGLIDMIKTLEENK